MILIEDASTGSPLAQELRRAGIYAVQSVPVEHDKKARLYVQQGKFPAGQVLFPRQASFMSTLLAELLAFPHSKYDDQVNSITQALASTGSKYNYDTTMSWVRRAWDLIRGIEDSYSRRKDPQIPPIR